VADVDVRVHANVATLRVAGIASDLTLPGVAEPRTVARRGARSCALSTVRWRRHWVHTPVGAGDLPCWAAHWRPCAARIARGSLSGLGVRHRGAGDTALGACVRSRRVLAAAPRGGACAPANRGTARCVLRAISTLADSGGAALAGRSRRHANSALADETAHTGWLVIRVTAEARRIFREIARAGE
jgi:hypothetical protein